MVFMVLLQGAGESMAQFCTFHIDTSSTIFTPETFPHQSSQPARRSHARALVSSAGVAWPCAACP
jgi:hypothetical protein